MWQSILGGLAQNMMGKMFGGGGQDQMQQPLMQAQAGAQGQMSGPEPYQSIFQQPAPQDPNGMFNRGFNVDNERMKIMQMLAQGMGR
jgi:hypothetical protein